MHGFDFVVGRWRPALAVGITWCCYSAGYAAEPYGPAATISVPVASIPAASAGAVVDPFQKAGVIATPFVPYAARGTDLDPIMRPVDAPAAIAPSGNVASPQPAEVTPPSIDAGDLVPVTLPTAATLSSEPASKPRSRKTAKTGAAMIEPRIEATPVQTKTNGAELKAAKPAEATTKLMQPEPSNSFDAAMSPNAAIPPSSAMTPIRPASVSRDVAPAKQPEVPATNGSPYSPGTPARPWPTNFSFPQPVIPLESSLWKLLDVTGKRH